MRFGNCVSFKDAGRIEVLKKTGFDYIETGLAGLNAAEPTEIANFIDVLEKNSIRCEAVNVLFPGGTVLTGDNADIAAATEYLDKVLEKTRGIGYEVVVFGSGGARKYPEGFSKERALQQIIELAKNVLCERAERYNFTIALEELNRGETNIVNSLAEAKYIVDEVGSPRFKMLADFYHIALEKDDVSQIKDYGGILAHCHIASPNKRYYPQKTDTAEIIGEYEKFFTALSLAGYDRRISIEGGLGAISKDFEEESRLSLEFMKGLAR